MKNRILTQVVSVLFNLFLTKFVFFFKHYSSSFVVDDARTKENRL